MNYVLTLTTDTREPQEVYRVQIDLETLRDPIRLALHCSKMRRAAEERERDLSPQLFPWLKSAAIDALRKRLNKMSDEELEEARKQWRAVLRVATSKSSDNVLTRELASEARHTVTLIEEVISARALPTFNRRKER